MRREIIGSAELLLGDARDVLPGLADASVDFIFTDPPYGHNNNNGDLIHRWEQALGITKEKTESRPIHNDGAEANDLVRWFFGEANRLLPKGACCCCCGGGGPDPQFARWSLWLDEAVGFKQMVVWDKGPMGMGWHYRRSYETGLVGEKPGAACRWYDETAAVENIIRAGRVPKILPREDQHPTYKTPRLAAHFIALHSRPGDLVLDPFMGAGSTMIAAMAMGRRFIGVELEERWFDMACREAEVVVAGSEKRAVPEQISLNLSPDEDAADAAGSYYAAIAEIGRRVANGAPVPNAGYFAGRVR